MNALTKVFIVLMVIFSITFTIMTVQFSATVPNWRDQAIKARSKIDIVDAANRNLSAAKVAAETRAAADRATWAQERGELSTQLDESRRQVDEAKSRNTQMEAELASKDATYKILAAEVKVAQEAASQARSQRTALEERNIELEKRTLDLNEALNEKIASIMVLEQQARQQEQALNILKEERDKMMRRLNLRASGVEDSTVTLPSDRVRPLGPARVAAIRGRISEVGRDFATISVGSSDGVEVGMVFIIYNQNGYLGDLTVSEVTPNEAAGRLKNVTGAIGVGDMVADENGYLAMN